MDLDEIYAEVDRRIELSERRCEEGQKRLQDELGGRISALENTLSEEVGANKEFRENMRAVTGEIRGDVKSNGESAAVAAAAAASTAKAVESIAKRLQTAGGDDQKQKNGGGGSDDDKPGGPGVFRAATQMEPRNALALAILVVTVAACFYMLGGRADDLPYLRDTAPAVEASGPGRADVGASGRVP